MTAFPNLYIPAAQLPHLIFSSLPSFLSSVPSSAFLLLSHSRQNKTQRNHHSATRRLPLHRTSAGWVTSPPGRPHFRLPREPAAGAADGVCARRRRRGVRNPPSAPSLRGRRASPRERLRKGPSRARPPNKAATNDSRATNTENFVTIS